jgi:hypothetical protein
MDYHASKYIEEQCEQDKFFKFNIDCLDQYDFSEFLTEGKSLWAIRNAIEEKYDKEFKEKYQIYVFDSLDGDDTCQYFASRYNIWFQEYTDWVVRRDNGVNAKIERRT